MTDYCLRCGRPHDGICGRTLAERLDNTADGAEFGAVLNELMNALDKARWDTDDDDE